MKFWSHTISEIISRKSWSSLKKHDIFYNYENVFLINGIPIGDSRMNSFKKIGNDENQRASPTDQLELLIELITMSKIKKDQRIICWVKMFGLKRYKSATLDFYVLFGLYLKIYVGFCCDSSWDGN